MEIGWIVGISPRIGMAGDRMGKVVVGVSPRVSMAGDYMGKSLRVCP